MEPGIRDAAGRFVPGVSGNKNGRRKDIYRVSEMAREYTQEALETLVRWMREGEGKVSVAASNAILDRAWGKPQQGLEVTGKDGAPVAVAGLDLSKLETDKLQTLYRILSEAPTLSDGSDKQ